MMCTYWALIGQCMSNKDFMVKYCHKACSRCDVDSVGVYTAVNAYIVASFVNV